MYKRVEAESMTAPARAWEELRRILSLSEFWAKPDALDTNG